MSGEHVLESKGQRCSCFKFWNMKKFIFVYLFTLYLRKITKNVV